MTASTAPSATPELDEVIDATFALVIRLKTAVAEESPGGSRMTLDELLTSVTDGRVRTSIQSLISVIEDLVQGGRPDALQLIETVITAVLEFIGHLREAISDGFQVSDLLAGVTDGDLREDLRRAFDGIEKIQLELTGLNMWVMFALVQRVSAWIPRLVAA